MHHSKGAAIRQRWDGRDDGLIESRTAGMVATHGGDQDQTRNSGKPVHDSIMSRGRWVGNEGPLTAVHRAEVDFRRRVPADGHRRAAESSAHDQHPVLWQIEPPSMVAAGERAVRYIWRIAVGQGDLAPMCVARECDREGVLTQIEQPGRSVHENEPYRRSARERLRCIGVAGRMIVESTYCHLVERRWQSSVCIGQYLDTSPLERPRDRQRPRPVIVVAENCEASRTCRDLCQTVGETTDIMVPDGHEVAAEEKEVWRSRRQGGGGPVQQPAGRQRTGVEVACECNPELSCRSERITCLYALPSQCDLGRGTTTLRESGRPVGRGQKRLGTLPEGTQSAEVPDRPFGIHGVRNSSVGYCRPAACLRSAANDRSSISEGAWTLVCRTYLPFPSSSPFGSFKDDPLKKPNCT